MNAEYARRQMVEQQIRTYEVFDPRVLAVFAEVRREDYVPGMYRELAFSDVQLPLGHGQFMMTPSIEGRMLQALELGPGDHVLEIGTGTGFTCACMSRLAGAVTSVDIFPDLADQATAKLKDDGIDNATVLAMDATRELPDGEFDAVAVTASCPLFDTRFYDVLKPGGRLFVIVGNSPTMDAELIVRGTDDKPQVTRLFETDVLPLINAPAPPAFRF